MKKAWYDFNHTKNPKYTFFLPMIIILFICIAVFVVLKKQRDKAMQHQEVSKASPKTAKLFDLSIQSL